MRQALYRVYRPKNFDEVVGQEHITTVLKNEIEAGQPSHAYLFVGSRGTGKTTCAKLMAKAVNCENPQNGNPCEVCDMCRGVDDATLLDVTEIDAASNNGVDNIRDLRDEAIYTPAVAKYRVYIIDEVHMLSQSAFNALLKILEEPPEHIIFVLATTEIHKVLPTIISRCQRFDFKRIASDIIAERLLKVADKEGINLDPCAAQLLARLADGGMRDALSLLDVCAAQQNDISAEAVTKTVGLVSADSLNRLIEYITCQNSQDALELLNGLYQGSLEPQRLCEQLINHFRDLMIIKTVKSPDDLVNCLPDEIPALKEIAAKLTLPQILSFMTLLQDTAQRISRSAVKRAELELAVISLCEGLGDSAQALAARIEKLEKKLAGADVKYDRAPVKANNEKKADLPPSVKPVEDKPAPEEKNTVNESSSAEESGRFTQWPQVLEKLKEINTAIAGMMMGSTAYLDNKRVLIDVQNPALLTMLKTNEYTKENIKQAIAMVTGVNYGIGPYRSQKEDKKDPLDELVESLPNSERIKII